jgi:protein O-mannosyl-transferase
LFRRLTGATWRSFFVAALFGWHPLRVESVAWVTERKDVLSACFGLLSLLFYAGYVEQSKVRLVGPKAGEGGSPRSKVFYGLTLLFFALGLMSKAMLVTWPLVMLLLDWWPLQRISSFKFSVSSSGPASPVTRHPPLLTLVVEKLPFFVLAAVVSVATLVVQQRGGAVTPIENIPWGARSGNALISYCRYLRKLFWPADLAVFYPHPGYWPVAQVLLAGGLLLVVTLVCLTARRRHPFMLMGWLWYVGTLVPVIGLVQAGAVALADRFTYLPSLGILILVIWGAGELTRRRRYRGMVLSAAGGVAVLVCWGMTRHQLEYWQDSETLFRHALAVTENNSVAHNGIGNALFKKGQVNEAISQFQEAIRLKPGNAEAHNSFGAALFKQSRIDEAISQFQEAIRLKPRFAYAHYNLGTALGLKGQTDAAISQFQEALRLKPDFVEVHYRLGTAWGLKGRMEEAIHQYQEALRLKPDDAEAHCNLGTLLGMTGQTGAAIGQFQEAVRLDPDYAEAHCGLGTMLGLTGQTDAAIGQFQEALRLKPDYAEARHNLAHALELKNAPTSR